MPREPKKQKPCAYCGELFTPRTKNSHFCSADCREAEQKKKQKERARVRQNASFVPVFEYIKRAYAETGVYLSYGKAVVRMQAEQKAEQQQQKKEQVEKKNERVSGENKQSVLAP